MNLVLCSDSKCPKKDTCCRFTTDPLKEIRARRKTRVEATLKILEEKECSKYWPITITVIRKVK